MPPPSPDHVSALLAELNTSDEHTRLEAKRSSELGKSLLETICALSNEPGLGGGQILCGVAKPKDTLFGQYTVEGVPQPDKLQLDIASKCASVFSRVVRPRVEAVKLEDKTVLLVTVDELPVAQKPLFFEKTGLPRGAWRRIGSSDQRCTDDDLRAFYEAARAPSPELDTVKGTSIEDVDPQAVRRYRRLRAEINPQAAELDDEPRELLASLNCLTESGELNLAGLLLFGKARPLRRYVPMFRLDYIRVNGNTWIEDAHDRFTTLDMREPILLLINKVVAAIESDLPKQFRLDEGQIQARYEGVPDRALREVIVNALMHQSYRVHQPTQVVRYHNRIEVLNPGHSLKPQAELGTKGSKLRNTVIASVLHDLNIAENKGSGISTVQRLMREADFAPPTFTSNRAGDSFNVTLSLQHFFDEDTLRWLADYESYKLSRDQRRGLVILRDEGRISNERYREINNVDSNRASADLRAMRDEGLITMHGGGAQTYYKLAYVGGTPPPKALKGGGTPPPKVLKGGGPPLDKGVKGGDTPPPKEYEIVLPDDLAAKIEKLPDRINDRRALWKIIQRLCAIQPLSSREIAGLIGRKEKYVRDRILPNVRAAGLIAYLYPDEPYRADQAYVATDAEIPEEL